MWMLPFVIVFDLILSVFLYLVGRVAKFSISINAKRYTIRMNMKWAQTNRIYEEKQWRTTKPKRKAKIKEPTHQNGIGRCVLHAVFMYLCLIDCILYKIIQFFLSATNYFLLRNFVVAGAEKLYTHVASSTNDVEPNKYNSMWDNFCLIGQNVLDRECARKRRS